jgi:peroxiredoxin
LLPPSRILSVLIPVLCLTASALLAAPAAAPKLKATDGAGLVKTIRAYKGKVVVVNLWATWCPPCVEEFPGFVKFHKDLNKDGVVVLGASLDEPEDKGKVAEFIAKEKVPFEILIRAKGSIEQFVNPLDKKWKGVAPTTYVFDRTGKQVGEQISGMISYEKLVQQVKPLL